MTETPLPCARCGYAAPAVPCPHCGWDGSGRLAGPWSGWAEGLLAVPQGLRLLARTPGTKRWLLPPLVLTAVALVLTLTWVVGTVNGMLDEALPGGVRLDPSWAWLDGLGEGWGWLQATWAWLVGAVAWVLNLGWSFVFSWGRWIGWFLIGSLVTWYCFSIVYEALAGPFLDEVQARIEERWWGRDPRSTLERPNDIPVRRCALLSSAGATLAAAVAFLAWPWLGVLGLLLAPALALGLAALVDRRYPAWLRWVGKVEGGALWASLQASVLTLALVALALPLYFVPVAGYFLFAAVTGFATAVGLLDIPLERRGWPLAMRLRFVGRHLPAFLTFGVAAGLLLAIPVVGPVVMVPSASIGGLWLVTRLDKGFLGAPPRPGPRA